MGHPRQVMGKDVARVLAQFMGGQPGYRLAEEHRIDEGEQDAAYDFQDAVETFEHDPDVESFMQDFPISFLCHFRKKFFLIK